MTLICFIELFFKIKSNYNNMNESQLCNMLENSINCGDFNQAQAIAYNLASQNIKVDIKSIVLPRMSNYGLQLSPERQAPRMSNYGLQLSPERQTPRMPNYGLQLSPERQTPRMPNYGFQSLPERQSFRKFP